MFERYTEKARRTIFFARYEASQFGTPSIETEHLLLGLLREDKTLGDRVLGSHEAVESIRQKIAARSPAREHIPTSVDLPLTHECTRVLAHAADEGQRLNHEHIGTDHLLLGLMREEKSFAAQLLYEQGLTLHRLREMVKLPEPPPPSVEATIFARLDAWLGELENLGFRIDKPKRGDSRMSRLVYPAELPVESKSEHETTPADKVDEIRNRIECIVEQMENAIASHQFDQAHLFSKQERQERGNLRLLREQFNLPETQPRAPIVRIEVIRDEQFSHLRRRCDDHLSKGAGQVWLLDLQLKRAFTVTREDGLREVQGQTLELGSGVPGLDLAKIFA